MHGPRVEPFLARRPTERRCRSCDAAVPAQAQACRRCGTRLQASAPQAPAQAAPQAIVAQGEPELPWRDEDFARISRSAGEPAAPQERPRPAAAGPRSRRRGRLRRPAGRTLLAAGVVAAACAAGLWALWPQDERAAADRPQAAALEPPPPRSGTPPPSRPEAAAEPAPNRAPAPAAEAGSAAGEPRSAGAAAPVEPAPPQQAEGPAQRARQVAELLRRAERAGAGGAR